ncbi:6-phosphogluconolactonase [uncultured Pseudokineococcus sp.]|uniref:6-phosphogluconolactonase n=1 Tax=uncultured Pseudokineococcus sp. TaxID=1642928 RepID=UPI00262B883A|nr:6-phosphogluconolactonase [uncultured Pseudokineococcus sp.]
MSAPSAPGGAPPEIAVLEDADALVADVADRLLAAVGAALEERPAPAPVHVVLTGGRIGGRALAAVADAVGIEDGAPPAGDGQDGGSPAALDWSRVHLWFGDERFVDAGSDERNDVQARAALLRAPALHAARWHPMPADDAGGGPEAAVDAAARYAAELAEHADDLGPGGEPALGVPVFDVLLLGVGPDGHVASLFPGRPALGLRGATVVVEEDAPKPPPLRLSLGADALRAAAEVWLVVSGEDKATAVARGLDPEEDAVRTPAVVARGRRATRWLVDRAAASQLHG